MLFTTAILSITTFAALCYFLVLISRFVRSYVELRKIPGEPIDNIIIGNVSIFWLSPENIFKKLREWARIYYPIYNVSVLHVISPSLLKPADFELVLSNPKHNDKSIIYDLFHNWLRTGLLTSGGKKWAMRRKILTPAFHFKILQNFISVFNEETDNLVQSFKNHCHEPFIEVNSYVTEYTLKTIAETAMGTKLNTKRGEAYKQAIFDIGQIYVYRLTRAWFVDSILNLFSPKFFQERGIVKTLHRFTEEVIEERKKTFKDIVFSDVDDEVYIGKIRLAMLDLLLKVKEEEGVIDDRGIREEVDTFMFEGHDTTAAALCFALMLIACHKDVQDLIVEEMRMILGDLRKKPTYNDLQEMKYLERTINEVLRLYPSVPLISRKLGGDLKTADGYLLPKDSVVVLHIYDIHHNPDVYPEPDKFDPDRFLPENVAERHPFAYVPFSAGPRNCIGRRFAMLEMKAALCGVLGTFILEPVDTPSSVVMIADMILRTKNDIKVKFVLREETGQFF